MAFVTQITRAFYSAGVLRRLARHGRSAGNKGRCMDTRTPNGHQGNEELPDGQIAVPVIWDVPDTISSRYATNIIVQNTGSEFVISFFEIPPPILLGSPEEQAEQAQALKSVKATCVARIIVSTERMPNFVKAMTGNLSNWQSRSDKENDDD